jgi:hypothetical protein
MEAFLFLTYVLCKIFYILHLIFLNFFDLIFSFRQLLFELVRLKNYSYELFVPPGFKCCSYPMEIYVHPFT